RHPADAARRDRAPRGRDPVRADRPDRVRVGLRAAGRGDHGDRGDDRLQRGGVRVRRPAPSLITITAATITPSTATAITVPATVAPSVDPVAMTPSASNTALRTTLAALAGAALGAPKHGHGT